MSCCENCFFSPIKSVNNPFSVWNVAQQDIDSQIEAAIVTQSDTYSCSMCGYSNSAKNDLKKHVETHLDTPGYQCQFCDKVFKTRNSLNTHQSVKHREQRRQFNQL